MRDWVKELEEGVRLYNAEGPIAFIEVLERKDAIHPEFLCHVQDDLPNGGDWHGVDGFRQMSRTWLEAWDEFTVTPHEFIQPTPNSVLVPNTQKAVARDGMKLEGEFAYVFLLRDDQLAQFRIYADRGRAEQAAADWT